MTASNERRPYEVEVLIGTVYHATVWAENLVAAVAIAEEICPGDEFVEEGEVTRTTVVSHAFGVTAFGFGVENVTGVRS